MMNSRKYIAKLVEKTGIRIDENDPIFAIGLLNQMILEEQKTALETWVDNTVQFKKTKLGYLKYRLSGLVGFLVMIGLLLRGFGMRIKRVRKGRVLCQK